MTPSMAARTPPDRMGFWPRNFHLPIGKPGNPALPLAFHAVDMSSRRSAPKDLGVFGRRT